MNATATRTTTRFARSPIAITPAALGRCRSPRGRGLAIDEQADVLDPAHRDAAGDAPSSAPVPRGVTGRAHAGTGRVLRAPGFAAWNASATAHTGDLPEMEHRKSSSGRPRRRESVGGTTTFVVVRDA